jgi:hypothetical protein
MKDATKTSQTEASYRFDSTDAQRAKFRADLAKLADPQSREFSITYMDTDEQQRTVTRYTSGTMAELAIEFENMGARLISITSLFTI